MAQVKNVVLAGLGGKGVIKASDILADAAFRDGVRTAGALRLAIAGTRRSTGVDITG